MKIIINDIFKEIKMFYRFNKMHKITMKMLKEVDKLISEEKREQAEELLIATDELRKYTRKYY